MTLRSAIARGVPGHRLDAALRRLDRHTEALKELRGRLGKHDGRLAKVEATAKVLSMDFARIQLQLAALETKVETVARERDPAPITGDSEAVARARDVVAIVQQEHEQIRARFQIITRYEERLRRVEDSLLASEAATEANGPA
jgi:predicted component of type VI protein secretion system